MIPAIILRDIKLAFRSGSDWLLGMLFFILFLSLCVIAIGTGQTLKSLAAALIWLAFLLSALLSFPHIFADDYADGSLVQLYLFTQNMTGIVISKTLSFAITALLPIMLVLPIAAIMLGIDARLIAGLLISLLIALPAISIYGVFASALTVARGSGGFLIFLITVPFLVPVFIFGVNAPESFVTDGLFATPIKALPGLSLIAIAIGLPAASAALMTNYE